MQGREISHETLEWSTALDCFCIFWWDLFCLFIIFHFIFWASLRHPTVRKNILSIWTLIFIQSIECAIISADFWSKLLLILCSVTLKHLKNFIFIVFERFRKREGSGRELFHVLAYSPMLQELGRLGQCKPEARASSASLTWSTGKQVLEGIICYLWDVQQQETGSEMEQGARTRVRLSCLRFRRPKLHLWTRVPARHSCC